MEELINALNNTKEFIMIKVQEPGLDLTFNSKIIDTEIYEDGITLFLCNESEIFISSLINTLISVDTSSEDCTEYVLTTPNKAIITIMVAN